ncbi:undecaprenyl-diphosphatase [Peptoclostridium litorale DSM 5388]|uniref:Membrane-associated phospholipid phosphatase n=1 Tax=Peptoclostridium litorale DSM 5388 TaxID=1121324 RepID=A0A069RNE6_PEPLI|nr:phosphatase PAP2 family protein [Peptoclostridium litorale]KDR95702.1 membrane-associated phospholipid phosphatase [Peptoclostridium litorale DSM 5388]SIO01456.1 undecaprenyl-diphosphatase [Peptoclostridium litorale DSM 5388]
MLTYIQAVDMKLLQWIAGFAKNDFFDFLMPIVTKIGNKGMIWIVIALVLMATKKYRRHGIVLAGALLIGVILGDGFLKKIFQRPRPFEEIEGMKLLIKAPTTYSFPSGHTTASFGAFWALHKKFSDKRVTAGVFLLAAFISFSRMYLFVHYPTDIAAGVILGIASASLALKAEKAFESKKVK